MAFTSGGIKGLIQGALGAVTSAEKTRADQLGVRRTLVGSCATALNTNANFTIIPALFNESRIKAARISTTSAAAQASAAADGWLFSLKYDDGAGGSSTVCNVTFNTTTASIGPTVARAMTVASEVTIPANSRLFVLCTATNTAVNANALAVAFALDLEET